jgi:hypothetical protein
MFIRRNDKANCKQCIQWVFKILIFFLLALYACFYFYINFSLIEPLALKDIQITRASSSTPVSLNQPISIICRVSEAFPKPSISFVHQNGTVLNHPANEKILSEQKPDEFNFYTISSMYNFTPSYTDHNIDINCSVSSNTSTLATLSKPLHINVNGEFILLNLIIFLTKI